jgi:hypothetical protein
MSEKTGPRIEVFRPISHTDMPNDLGDAACGTDVLRAFFVQRTPENTIDAAATPEPETR